MPWIKKGTDDEYPDDHPEVVAHPERFTSHGASYYKQRRQKDKQRREAARERERRRRR